MSGRVAEDGSLGSGSGSGSLTSVPNVGVSIRTAVLGIRIEHEATRVYARLG